MATATFHGNEITAVFTADWQRTDYGVPNSTFYEIDDDSIELLSLEILGVDVDISKLPADLQTSIMELVNETEFED